jgi:predicted small lipoprotein YifL
MKKEIATLSALILILSGCGKKGPLVLAPEKRPTAVEALRLSQVGSQIELRWKFPSLLSDNQTPLPASQIRGVSIYGMSKPFVPGTFEKKSDLLARPKFSELANLGEGVFAYSLPFKAKLLMDKEHAFALTYLVGRTRSDLSEVKKITTRIPPEPVHDLKAGREGKVVVLSWSRPQAYSEGQGVPAITGYKIYRRIRQGNDPGAFAAINDGPVSGEYFQDHDTGADGEYEYHVASLLAESIESAPSNLVSLRIQDTFPPEVPANLVAFTAKDHVFLTWETVPDKDLDHYVIYRMSSKEKDFKILAAAVTENFYHDRQAARGESYTYSVAAVDKKGNESEPSRPVRQVF